MKQILFSVAILSQSVWADIPGGAMNGNVFNMEGSCFMEKGAPIATTKFGVQVYAPGKITYGSECPAGIPVPKINQ